MNDQTASSSAGGAGARAASVAAPPLALLALMMAIGPFGDTEYTPAMPDIAQSLGADYGLVQTTMVSYLIANGVSELAYGPLADRFGRRNVMLAGAGILSLGALICALSFAVWPLIGGRFIQGFGASAGGVIAKACVRDAIPQDRRERVFAQLQAAFALAPAVGPVVGSLVSHAMDWHINFVILLALSIATGVLAFFFLPETKPDRNYRAIQPARLWRNYKRPLKAPDFLFYSVLAGCCIGVTYTSLIGAPGLVINLLHDGSIAIIIVAAAILLGFVTGAGLCALVSERLADLWIIALGLAVLAVGSLGMLGVALVIGKSGGLASYLVPIAFNFIGVGAVVPVCTHNAMAPYKQMAGLASSLFGFLMMIIASIGTLLMSVLHRGTVYDMPIVFLILTGAAIAVFAITVAVRGVKTVRR